MVPIFPKDKTALDLREIIVDIDGEERLVSFTAREADLLACLFYRQTNQEISDYLSIKKTGVESHILNIRGKLGGVPKVYIHRLFSGTEESKILAQHFKYVKIHHIFEQYLKKVSEEIADQEITASIIFDTASKDAAALDKRRVADVYSQQRKKKSIVEYALEKAGIQVNRVSGDGKHIPPKTKIIYVTSAESKGGSVSLDTVLDFGKKTLVLQVDPAVLGQQPLRDSAVSRGQVTYIPVHLGLGFYDSIFRVISNLDSNYKVVELAREFDEEVSAILGQEDDGVDIQNSYAGFQRGEKSTHKNAWISVILACLGLIVLVMAFIFVRDDSSIGGKKEKTLPPQVSMMNRQTSLFSSAQPIKWKLLPKVQHFTERKKLAAAVWKKFDKKKDPLVIVGLYGLGGVGKTFLASHLVNMPANNYEFRGWFNSETEELLKASYFQLGENYKLFDKEESSDVKIIKVKNWLEKRKSSLIVFDNVKDSSVLKDFLPSKGHIIITSRNPNLESAIEIGTMTEHESLVLLNKLVPLELQKSPTYQGKSKELVRELGYLPLAIAQAGAYIAEHVVTVREYLELYKTENSRLLQENVMPPGDKHEPVYTTWNINVKTIKQLKHGESAIKALDFLSYCSPDHIPRKLITQYSLNDVSDKSEFICNKCTSLLRRHSLIKVFPSEIFIHRLVQSWNRQRHSKEEKIKILKNAAKALTTLCPRDIRTKAKADSVRMLVPHMEKVLYRAKPLLKDKDILGLLSSLGESYFAMGEYERSKQLLEEALTIKRRVYGSNHIETAYTLRTLGKPYNYLGHYTKARQILEEALAIMEKNLGPDHVQIADTSHLLGITLFHLGYYGEAKKLLEKALVVKERYYGTQNVRVADTYHLLGSIYLYLGKSKQAKEFVKKALAIKEKCYDYQHVRTADTLEVLGRIYVYLGNVHRAKRIFEKALTIKRRYYGNDHVGPSHTLHQLGRVYHYLGNYSESKRFLEHALIIKKKYFGHNHVKVAHTLNQLARLHYSLGEYSKAGTYAREAIAIKKKHYGPKHPMTTYSLDTLGTVLLKEGKIQESIQTHEDVFEVVKQKLGVNHVFNVQSLTNLAMAYSAQGDYSVGKQYFLEAREIAKVLYGEEHLFTAVTSANVGNAYRLLGDKEKSKDIQEKALALLRKNYGFDHIDVAKIMVNLALLYGELGEGGKKKKMLDKAISIFKRYVSSDHFCIKEIAKYRESENHDAKKRDLGFFTSLHV